MQDRHVCQTLLPLLCAVAGAGIAVATESPAPVPACVTTSSFDAAAGAVAGPSPRSGRAPSAVRPGGRGASG